MTVFLEVFLLWNLIYTVFMSVKNFDDLDYKIVVYVMFRYDNRHLQFVLHVMRVLFFCIYVSNIEVKQPLIRMEKHTYLQLLLIFWWMFHLPPAELTVLSLLGIKKPDHTTMVVYRGDVSIVSFDYVSSIFSRFVVTNFLCVKMFFFTVCKCWIT